MAFNYKRTNNEFHRVREERARKVLMSDISAHISNTTGVKGVTHQMIADELGLHRDTIARAFSGNPIGAPTITKIFEWEEKHK